MIFRYIIRIKLNIIGEKKYQFNFFNKIIKFEICFIGNMHFKTLG